MSQRRLHSLGEAVFNNVVSFGVAYWLNLAVLPWIKHNKMSDHQMAFWLVLLFSAVSVVRQYFIRRLFNWWHHRKVINE